MDKKAIIKDIIFKLEKRLETFNQTIEKARKLAINSPASIQSWSDTTKYQSSQLASNLQDKHAQLQKYIKSIKEIDINKKYKEVEIGALVKAQKTKELIYYFISPEGSGGEIIKLNNHEIITLSVDSPLAQAILGKKAGESAKFEIPPELQTILIKEIK